MLNFLILKNMGSLEVLELKLANIHCEDCETSIYRSLSRFFKIKILDKSPTLEHNLQEDADDAVTLIIKDGELKVCHESEVAGDKAVISRVLKKIIQSLRESGFQVLSWELSLGGKIELSSSMQNFNADTSVSYKGLGPWKWWKMYRDYSNRKYHMKHCKKCQEERQQSRRKMDAKSTSTETSGKSSDTLAENPDNGFSVVLSISGMTCNSCVLSISQAIELIIYSSDDCKQSEDRFGCSIDLIKHSATVIVPNKQVINKIIREINGMGFECRLLDVLPIKRSINMELTAMIGGITCAACAASIQSAIDDLPFVLECNINPLTRMGKFILERPSDSDKLLTQISKLKETIENCGFNFEVTRKLEIQYSIGVKSPRSVNIAVEGMYCSHCPDAILRYLNSYGNALVVEDKLSLKSPFLKFNYVSDIKRGISIRKFLNDLNHLYPITDSDSGNYEINYDQKGPFECRLIEPVSMDEHLKRMMKNDLRGIIYRLIIATTFAIPTFVFGVVGPSLLRKGNRFRKWLEEPLWVGSVLRMTWIMFILSTPVYFFAADIFHRRAMNEIKSIWLNNSSFRRRFLKFGSMNLLMTLGTSISYFASLAQLILYARQPHEVTSNTTYFDSVVFLTFFLLIGRLLESLSKDKAADAMADLKKLKATEVTLVEISDDSNGTSYSNENVVSVKCLEVGDCIRISPGESPPVDCVIMTGDTAFDESVLSGEARPVERSVGQQVFSGTVNVGSRSIIAKVISLEGDSLLDQIVNTVREGQLRKAPIERTADMITGYFVPAIVYLAVLTWIIWLALGYSGSLPKSYLDISLGGWVIWSLEFAIAVFVIACPCGIGLAAPTALLVGSGIAAKYGILAKGGGVAFQEGSGIGVICFDKTGTLTNGSFALTDYAFTSSEFNLKEDEDALKLISIQCIRDLELALKHPLAKSVLEFINSLSGAEEYSLLTEKSIPHVEAISGRGLKGAIMPEFNIDDSSPWTRIRPTEAILGNQKLMEDFNVKLDVRYETLLEKWKSDAKSVVLLALKCPNMYRDDKFHMTMILACRDEPRKEAAAVVEYLEKNLHIECYMISGDNKVTAEAIGRELNLSNVKIISDVLPEEKQNKVKSLQLAKGKTVAMVGDGVNDAPALAAADVGIALSTGTDLAMTSSDFILLNRSQPLIALLTLIELSKTVFRRVKINFVWALLYNTIGIPVAAGVIYPYHNSRLSPIWASAAMAASSVSVVLSSLALKFFKPQINMKDIGRKRRQSLTLKPKEYVII